MGGGELNMVGRLRVDGTARARASNPELTEMTWMEEHGVEGEHWTRVGT